MPLSRHLQLLTSALSLVAATSGASGPTPPTSNPINNGNIGRSSTFHARRSNTDSRSSTDDLVSAAGLEASWLDATSPDLLGGADKRPKLPKKRQPKPVPQYVLDHAPLVHLSEDEMYWPSSLEDHLQHTTPYDDYLPVNRSEQHPTLDNLGDLNSHKGGEHVYLHSKDAVETDPKWLLSEVNIPVDPALADRKSVV